MYTQGDSQNDEAEFVENIIKQTKKAIQSMLREDLSPAQPEPQWILCSERLPEDGIEVFVYLYGRPSPYIAWVEDCHWYTEEFEVEKEYYPLAWMSLPKPYAERREE